MVQLLQRMRRDILQWQVRAEGSQRQNSILMQQLIDKQVVLLPCRLRVCAYA